MVWGRLTSHRTLKSSALDYMAKKEEQVEHPRPPTPRPLPPQPFFCNDHQHNRRKGREMKMLFKQKQNSINFAP